MFDFQYLGSVVEAIGGIQKEVSVRTAKASHAFDILEIEPFWLVISYTMRVNIEGSHN